MYGKSVSNQRIEAYGGPTYPTKTVHVPTGGFGISKISEILVCILTKMQRNVNV